ncbi:MAG TPA: enoyl-CoA hydratase/isomerase family protein [Acidimicrobiales bacterium]|nr:enoyl-CoA hydratase/isomerase family protein [Acidimicrobiales bacterium]
MSDAAMPSDLTTLLCEVHDGVARVTLNRPEVHNAFNETMQDELQSVWRWLRFEDSVRAVVVTGAGDKAFCTGIDRNDIPVDTEYDPFTYEDPGRKIGPKSQELWKPVIAAVNGMACAGGFYLLGESDMIIAAEHATFFDPHVTYTMTAAYEPILLMNRMAFGDLVRMTLVGALERMSARTAREAGLVSEVVAADELLPTAEDLAARIAAAPAVSVQATLRTLWAARTLSSDQALALGNVFLQLGTSSRALQEGQQTFTRRKPGTWKLR